MLQWKPDKHQALKLQIEIMRFFAPQGVSLCPHLQSLRCLATQALHKHPSFARAPSHTQGDVCTCRRWGGVKASRLHWSRGQLVLPCFSSCKPHPGTGKCYPQTKLRAIFQVSTKNGFCPYQKSSCFKKKNSTCLSIVSKVLFSVCASAKSWTTCMFY